MVDWGGGYGKKGRQKIEGKFVQFGGSGGSFRLALSLLALQSAC